MHRPFSRLLPFLLLLTPALARAAATTTIECPLFEGGAGKAFFLQCARDYEKVRPDVKVDLYLDPRIQEKIQVRVLEADFPEMTNVSMNFWPLIRNGVCYDFSKLLDGPNWEGDAKWRDTFLPGTLEWYAENGKVYGIPFGYYAYVFWFNKKMFAEHGWTPPKTWDELFTLCEKVKRAGIAPMAFQGRYPYYAMYLYDAITYHLAGPKQWEARQDLAPGAIAAPESVRGIELVRKLAFNYFQPGALGMSHTESQLQFFLGKTAMIPCGAWLKSEMLGKIPDDFELGSFNLPYISENEKFDKTAVRAAVEPYVIFSKSAHPEIAADFLRFMTSRAQAGKFSRMQDIPTAVKEGNKGNLSKDLDDLVRIVETSKSSYGTPSHDYPEMFQVYTDMLYDTIADPNHLTPEQVAQKYERIGQNLRRRTVDPTNIQWKHKWEPGAFFGLLALGAIAFTANAARGVAKRRRPPRRTQSAGLHKLSLANILLFVAPAILIYTTFVIVPSARSFSWSLHEWNGLTDMHHMPFVGLLNFKRLLLESDDFWRALKNNLFLMFVVPVFVVPLALFLAASISRGIWGGNFFRIVFFFPNLLGGVAATLLWLHLYNPQGGLVNTALVGLGFKSFAAFTWLEPKHLYWALIPISIWGTVGFNMVLYLAAMQSVDESYYEAATIDGASSWRQFWTITVPLIWDILAISIVFLIIGGMKAFEMIFLLSNQRPQGDAHVIATRMVQTMFYEFHVGEAAAYAVLLFLMVFVGSAATLRGLRRETVEQ